MDTSERDRFLSNLAAAFLSGAWNARSMTAAAARATGGRFRWVALLAKRALTHFRGRPAFEPLLAFIESDSGAARACQRLAEQGFPIHVLYVPRAEMHSPPAALAGIDLPRLPTTTAVAEWLGIPSGRLDWLADPSGRNRLHAAAPLRASWPRPCPLSDSRLSPPRRSAPRESLHDPAPRAGLESPP